MFAVLIAHVIGAVLTGAVVLYALYLLMRADIALMTVVTLILSSLAAFEVATGVALAVLSESITVASVCDNIVLYLALVGLVEAALFARLRKLGSTYPTSAALSPIAGSVLLVVSGVLLGL